VSSPPVEQETVILRPGTARMLETVAVSPEAATIAVASPAPALHRRFVLRIGDVAVLGVFLAIFALAVQPVLDNDVFWHLATGRFIAATGSIPHADPFSWTAPGRPWIAHEWLTETWLYRLYTLGGYPALSYLFAGVIVLALAISYRTARLLGATRPLAAGLTFLAALASTHTWGARPQMISLVFVAVTVQVLVRTRLSGRVRLVWIVPALMEPWVNTHGGFIFGLVLILIYAGGTTVEAIWTALRGGAANVRGVLTPWAAFAVAVAVSLVNPNGLKGLLYPFSYLGNNASTRYVAEWVKPDFTQRQYQYFGALLLLLVLGLVLARRRPLAWEAGLIVLFSYLGLSSVRNINLFGIVVTPLIALYLTSAGERLRARRPRPRTSPGKSRIGQTSGRSILNAGLASVIAVAVLVAAAPNAALAHTLRKQANGFPAGAVAYIEKNHPVGRLFNSYDWGGYLIWRLYPAVRVYVDGRPDMYGDAFVDRFVRTWRAEGSWQQTLRHEGVDLVLVEPTSGIGKALAALTAPGHGRGGGWRILYRDRVSVVYARDPRR